MVRGARLFAGRRSKMLKPWMAPMTQYLQHVPLAVCQRRARRRPYKLTFTSISGSPHRNNEHEFHRHASTARMRSVPTEPELLRVPSCHPSGGFPASTLGRSRCKLS